MATDIIIAAAADGCQMMSRRFRLNAIIFALSLFSFRWPLADTPPIRHFHYYAAVIAR